MTDTISASQQKINFMNLLVTQMKYQDPLEPTSNEDMAAQLAQFSQLEQSELMNQNLGKLNSTFNQVLMNSELDYAKSLVGNSVCIEVEGNDCVGTVGEVKFGEDGVELDVYMKFVDEETQEEWIETKTVSLDDIKSVLNL